MNHNNEPLVPLLPKSSPSGRPPRRSPRLAGKAFPRYLRVCFSASLRSARMREPAESPARKYNPLNISF